jgi:hypothetical protein
MGYEVEFICQKCDLKIKKSEMNQVINFLKKQSGPGQVTLPGGIRYGGVNYLLNDLELIESSDEILLTAFALEMFGSEIDNHYVFNRIHSRSKWVVESTIDSIKEVFRQYSGTLEGHYEGEDGYRWGHFCIVNGKDIIKEQTLELNSQENSNIMFINDFKDVPNDIMMAFTPRLFASDVRIVEYSRLIKTKKHSITIPIIAKKEDNEVFVLLEPREWNKDVILEMKDIISCIKEEGFENISIQLVCGYQPPKEIQQLFSKKRQKTLNLFQPIAVPYEIDIPDSKKVNKLISEIGHIPFDINEISLTGIEEYSQLLSEKIQEKDFMILLEIGIALQSYDVITKALKNHKNTFNKKMDSEERTDSITNFAKFIEKDQNGIILKHIRENMDSWMNKGDLGAHAIPIMLMYAYKKGDEKLIKECCNWIAIINNDSIRSFIEEKCGKELFKEGYKKPGETLFLSSIKSSNKENHEDQLWLLSKIICHLMEHESPDSLHITNKFIDIFLKKLIYNEKDTNPTDTIVKGSIKYCSTHNSFKLLRIQIENYYRLKDDSYKEFISWRIATNAMLLNDIATMKKFAEIAFNVGIQRVNGPSWMGQYAGELLITLARKQHSEEISWLSNMFQTINPANYPNKNWNRINKQIKELTIYVILSNSYLLKHMQTDLLHKKIKNELNNISYGMFDYFLNQLLHKIKDAISEELVLIIEEVINERQDINKKYVASHLCYIYCQLYLQSQDEKYIDNIYKWLENLSSDNLSIYIRSNLISIYIETRELTKALSEARISLDEILNSSTIDSYDQVEFIERLIKFYDISNNPGFLDVSIKLFNNIKKFDDKKKHMGPLISRLVDISKNK